MFNDDINTIKDSRLKIEALKMWKIIGKMAISNNGNYVLMFYRYYHTISEFLTDYLNNINYHLALLQCSHNGKEIFIDRVLE